MDYFLRFSGEISDEDRVALDRPGFKLYENGYGVSAVLRAGDGPADMTMFHMVRVPANSDKEARERVVTALGRTPDDLRVAHSH